MDTVQSSPEDKVKRPLSVTLVSLLYMFLAVIRGGPALFIIFGSPLTVDSSSSSEIILAIGLWSLILTLAICLLAISMGLWWLKPWARIAAIIVSSLSIVITVLKPLLVMGSGGPAGPNCLALAIHILAIYRLTRYDVSVIFQQAARQRAATVDVVET